MLSAIFLPVIGFDICTTPWVQVTLHIQFLRPPNYHRLDFLKNDHTNHDLMAQYPGNTLDEVKRLLLAVPRIFPQ